MPRTKALHDYETFAEVLAQIGDVSPERIRLKPRPGTATEDDLLKLSARTDRLYELVDGVLVEKTMGMMESGLACLVITFLVNYVREHDLGLVTGEAGTLRLMPGLVRIPDVSFISFQQLPSRTWPTEPIPDLAPDLAVEVLSPSNTPGEMQRKLKDYFVSGVRLVWFIDPHRRTGSMYTAPDQARTIGENESLDGGEVLPGYTLPLSQVFAHLPARTEAKPTRRSRKRQEPS